MSVCVWVGGGSHCNTDGPIKELKRHQSYRPLSRRDSSAVVDLRGMAPTCPSMAQNVLNFMQFFGKFGKMYVDPPLFCMGLYCHSKNHPRRGRKRFNCPGLQYFCPFPQPLRMSRTHRTSRTFSRQASTGNLLSSTDCKINCGENRRKKPWMSGLGSLRYPASASRGIHPGTSHLSRTELKYGRQ